MPCRAGRGRRGRWDPSKPRATIRRRGEVGVLKHPEHVHRPRKPRSAGRWRQAVDRKLGLWRDHDVEVATLGGGTARRKDPGVELPRRSEERRPEPRAATGRDGRQWQGHPRMPTQPGSAKARGAAEGGGGVTSAVRGKSAAAQGRQVRRIRLGGCSDRPGRDRIGEAAARPWSPRASCGCS